MQAFLVPGFAQTGGVWQSTIAQLGTELPATAIEIPTEGNFADTVGELGRASGLYAGYSMGGRLALYLALEHPELVRRLVLVSATPGISEPAMRQQRKAADDELAKWIEDHSREEFLDLWTQLPIFDGVPAHANRQHRLSSPSDIAGQLRRLGQGSQPSLWNRLDELQMPVTFVAGENDPAYREIAEAAAALVSQAETRIVAGAGHALVHEDPAALAKLIVEATGEVGAR